MKTRKLKTPITEIEETSYGYKISALGRTVEVRRGLTPDAEKHLEPVFAVGDVVKYRGPGGLHGRVVATYKDLLWVDFYPSGTMTVTVSQMEKVQ